MNCLAEGFAKRPPDEMRVGPKDIAARSAFSEGFQSLVIRWVIFA